MGMSSQLPAACAFFGHFLLSPNHVPLAFGSLPSLFLPFSLISSHLVLFPPAWTLDTDLIYFEEKKTRRFRRKALVRSWVTLLTTHNLFHGALHRWDLSTLALCTRSRARRYSMWSPGHVICFLSMKKHFGGGVGSSEIPSMSFLLHLLSLRRKPRWYTDRSVDMGPPNVRTST
ncbi:hypothetical protein CPB85DRAFT_215281 [Mucidula mucida]|nr:hypothetical protein CPB85DRAFT_215281 [Mucidula mucida]